MCIRDRDHIGLPRGRRPPEYRAYASSITSTHPSPARRMSRVCFSELPSTSPVKSDGFLRSTSPGKVVPARAHGLSGNPARERSRRPAAGRGARGARAPTVGVPRLFNGAAVFSKTRVFRRRGTGVHKRASLKRPPRIFA
eukprot:4255261-Pyramimonas_sp.AAC.1